MNREQAKRIREELQEQVNNIAARYNLEAIPISARFGSSEIRMTVCMTAPSVHANEEFVFNGTQYAFVRYDRRKRKYPIIARRIDTGTVYRLPRTAMPGAFDGR